MEFLSKFEENSLIETFVFMQSKNWSSAAFYGLVLAVITITYQLIQTVFEPAKGIALILWAAKFVCTLWILYFFIREYAKGFEYFTYSNGFKFGVLVSFFSALLCAAYMFLHFAVLFPDEIAAQIEQAMTLMESSNPDALEQFSKIEDRLPQIIFIFYLIYNTIFGVIASSIIANYTKKGNLFNTPETL